MRPRPIVFRTEDGTPEPLTGPDDGRVRVRGWIEGDPADVERLLGDRRAALHIVTPSGGYASGSMSNAPTPDRPLFCERSPYPGAGYHCLLDAGHTEPHSDLTIMWDDNGNLVNADGSIIGPMR